MKKITFLFALLLAITGTTAKAQVVPQISTGEMVYEYNILLMEKTRYVRNDYETASGREGNIKHDGTLSETTSLRVKLVQTEGEYFRIVPLNVENYDNAYICAAGTNAGNAIKYSMETARSEWKLYEQNAANRVYHVLLKDDNTKGISMNSTGSSVPSTLLVAANYANSNSRVQFIPANANAENATVLPKVETILANGGNTGYLAVTDALHTALQTAYNNFSTSGTSENLAAVKTAYDNYKASTAVVLPSAGTVYHIDWIFAAPKSIYNSGDVSWGTFDASKNNYYWKIVDGKLMNGNGQYIQWDGKDENNDHLTVTGNAAEATAVVITPITGDNQFKIKFEGGNRYFHANNHGSGGGSGSNIITWDTSADPDGASAWRFNEISGYDLYTVAVAGLPEDILYEGGVSLNNTDQKAYNGGFFVKEGDAFAAADFAALSVEGFQSNGITVSSNTITVTYRVNDAVFANTLQTHVDEAEELLAIQGLGYPRTGSDARTELQEMVALAKAAIADHSLIVGDEIEHLNAKIAAYRTSTDVELPADGKAYTITSVQQTGNYVLYFDDAAAGDNTLKIGAKDAAASEYGASAIFVCRRVGDKCVFVNAGKGNYLSYRGKNANYAESMNAYTMQSTNAATVGGNVTAEIPFGLFCPYAKRTTAANASEGSLIVSINTTTFVGANDNFDQNIGYKNNYSNSLVELKL